MIFFIPPELARLLERSAKCDAVTTAVFLAVFDYVVPLLSLPLTLGVAEADIPTDGPYIHPDPTLAAKWQERLAPYLGLRVGLCWAGNPEQANDHRRSCTLADFAPLTTVPGCTFFSLQKGPPAEQAHPPPLDMMLHDFTGDLHDFDDTAALISALDLVISVDTAVTHLAGALDKPTWTLLSYVPNWRWSLRGKTTPWYPTMRLFRQHRHGDWHTVIERVAEELCWMVSQTLALKD